MSGRMQDQATTPEMRCAAMRRMATGPEKLGIQRARTRRSHRSPPSRSGRTLVTWCATGRWLVAGLSLAAVLAAAPAAAVEWPVGVELVRADQPAVPAATPPLPPPGVFPVQLVLDDDSSEGALGLADAGGARQFLWFNRFEQPAGAGFMLEEIWVLFPAGTGTSVGDAVELAVYVDPDGDPTNGAELLATFDVNVEAVDGNTFSLYPLATPVTINPPGDVLIGVVPRFIQPGDPITSPAAIDQTASQGRSWLAIWTGDPPDDPELPPDSLITVVEGLGPGLAGNWMIRGFGTSVPAREVPALDGLGLVALTAILVLAGMLMLMRRRHGGGATGLALLVTLTTPAITDAQVVIDDFTTAQATVADPPGGATSVVTAGADILGQRRDLAVTIQSGAGPVSAEVAGGVLVFTVPDTTPDSRGQALITWDADSDPDVLDPTGLGGVDLAAGGQGAFRLTVESASAGLQIEIEVHTDADHRSRVTRVLPAIAATTEVFFDFAALTTSPDATGPADLTQVGALTLRVIASEGTLTAAGLTTAPPQISAAQADFTDAGAPIGSGSVVPGETFRYRVTIDNAGGSAEGVELSNALDPTLIPGTFRSTPVVRADQYAGFGNVDLVVDGIALPALTANDFDPDGDPLNVVPVTGLATVQGGAVDIAADGTFVYFPPAGFAGIDAFDYTIAPVAGDPTENASGNPVGPFSGTATIMVDRTVWFVDNSHGGPFEGTQSNPFATLAAAQAASAAGDIIRLRQGDGTSTGYDAFAFKNGQQLIGGGVPLVIGGQTIEPADPGRPTLASGGTAITLAQNVTLRGFDIGNTGGSAIFGPPGGSGLVAISDLSIFGSGRAINLFGPTTLDATIDSIASSGGVNGVIADGVGGSLIVTGTTAISGTAGAAVFLQNVPAGAMWDFGSTTILNTGDDGVFLNANDPTAAIRFSDLAITTANGDGLVSLSGGIVDLGGNPATVSASNGAALSIVDTVGRTNGASGWTFQSLASTDSPARGLFLDGLSDDFTVIDAITIHDPDQIAIEVRDSPGRAVSFGAVTALDNDLGAGASANGVDLATNNAGASFIFRILTLVTDGGFGLRAGASTVSFTDAGTFIVANAGPGLDFNGTTIAGAGATAINEISSVDSAGVGISLVGVAGELFVDGGFVLNSAGTSVHVDGGAPVFTYHGEVAQPNAARVVEIQNTTGGTVSLPGQVTGTASALGVRLANNDGNVSFDGLDLGTAGTPLGSTGVTLVGGSTGTSRFADMTVFTAGANGFDANNGGVVEVTGAGNRVTSSNGIALRMDGGTTIGASGATFERIDASGAANGIVLNGTGNTGPFTVSGDGSMTGGVLNRNGSGGAITNTTNDAVSLTSAHNVTLRQMNVTNCGNASAGDDCIDSQGGGNHVLSAVTVSNATGTGVNEEFGNGWRLTNITGNNRVDHGSLFTSFPTASTHALRLRNTSTNGNLTISRASFTNQGAGNSATFVTVQAFGSSVVGFTVEGTRPGGAGTPSTTLFSGLRGDAILSALESGATGSMTTIIRNSDFRDAAANGSGSVAATVNQAGATHTVTIEDNIFNNLSTTLAAPVGVITTNVASNGGNLDATIQRNDLDIVQGTRRGIQVVAQPVGGSGTLDLTVVDNTIDRIPGNFGILVDVDDLIGTSTLTLSNNQIGQAAGFLGNVGETFDGAFLVRTRGSPAATNTLTISNNNIRATTSGGGRILFIDARDARTSNLNVIGNTIRNDDAGAADPEFFLRAQVGSPSVCLHLDSNNAIGNSGANGSGSYEIRQVNGTVNVEALATVNARNQGTVTTVGTVGSAADCVP